MIPGTTAAPGHVHCGVWFRLSDTSPYGVANNIGAPILEAQTVSHLKARSVKRIYGSYKNRLIDEPAVIATSMEGQG